MTDNQSTIDQLRTAAKLIAEHGHTTGEYEDGEGRLCLQGALMAAHGKETIEACVTAPTISAMTALKAVLPGRCTAVKCIDGGLVHPDGSLFDGMVGEQIYHFNDHHCDGGPEAILVLEQAAEKLEANG